MSVLRYVSHGDVVKDPAVPVPQWSLNSRGQRQARALATVVWGPSVGLVVTSAETKAQEMAAPFVALHGLGVDVRADTGEIDRSATGYVPPARHDELADQLFADPERSPAGWERAVDAQRRLLTALADVLGSTPPHDVLVVGHGGVGTLLWCSLASLPIDRRHDQAGPGNVWAYDLEARAPLHPWEPLGT